MSEHQPDALALTQALIERASISPDDKGCQDLIANILEPLGFELTDLSADKGEPPVRNTFFRLGTRPPLLLLAGHTDVVPPGQLEDWRTAPFQPTIVDGYLYGRGAGDMKASVAAMVCALSAAARQDSQDYPASVALLLTSDEESLAVDGTRLALEHLAAKGISIDRCLIGEPTSSQRCGDTVKIGRRGSMSARLIIFGKQGHIAYPHLADNPIHATLRQLSQVIDNKLDDGGDGFEPSSLQLSSIHAGVAGNVIPGQVDVNFNIRFNPQHSAASLREEIERRLQTTGLEYKLNWQDNPSEPFVTQRTDLAELVAALVAEECGIQPELSTSGGTSDGRFISQYCGDLVEFGPRNRTIHQANECVAIDEIRSIEKIYTELVLRHLSIQ